MSRELSGSGSGLSPAFPLALKEEAERNWRRFEVSGGEVDFDSEISVGIVEMIWKEKEEVLGLSPLSLERVKGFLLRCV